MVTAAAERRLIILGAGGHARVVSSIAAQTPDLQLVGVADCSEASLGEKIGATEVVGTYADLEKWKASGVTHVAVALGDNVERRRLLAEAERQGFIAATLIHPSAIIETNAVIGAGSVVCAGAILCAEVRIGKGAIINTGVIVDHETIIGDYGQISPGCRLAGRVTVGEGAFIGTGAIILPSVTVGSYSVVGAGAVVIEDVPQKATVVGIPAKPKSS